MTPAAHPCDPVRVHSDDGAHLTVCAYGGQVVGWSPATPSGADGPDGLWLSPLARCGDGAAVRGGIPVIFPQFAGRGPLPKHGFARTSLWDLDVGTSATGAARVTCVLRDDEVTRAVWPHRFTLTLLAEASGSLLSLTLRVRNDAGEGGDPLHFTAALHTYLAVDATSAVLHGASGLSGEDNAAGGATVHLPEGPLPLSGPLDVAVRDVRTPVEVHDTPGRRVLVDPGGFDSLVVWNPGPDHGLDDVPADGAARYACVEPAQLTPVEVAPGAAWQADTHLTALVPARDSGTAGR